MVGQVVFLFGHSTALEVDDLEFGFFALELASPFLVAALAQFGHPSPPAIRDDMLVTWLFDGEDVHVTLHCVSCVYFAVPRGLPSCPLGSWLEKGCGAWGCLQMMG
jgi:hypothetical protein